MSMDMYKKVEKPKQDVEIKENEIRITTQGKMRNYISYATSLFREKNATEAVLKAMGRAINKTVTIAEIIKRRIANLHQITQIESTDIKDIWEPLEDGLDKIETTRHVSSITIILSSNVLDTTSPGYQPPIPADQVRPADTFIPGPRGVGGDGSRGTRGGGAGGRYRGRGRGRGRGIRGGRGGFRGRSQDGTAANIELDFDNNVPSFHEETSGGVEGGIGGGARGYRGGRGRSRGRGRGRGRGYRGGGRGRGNRGGGYNPSNNINNNNNSAGFKTESFSNNSAEGFSNNNNNVAYNNTNNAAYNNNNNANYGENLGRGRGRGHARGGRGRARGGNVSPQQPQPQMSAPEAKSQAGSK